MRTATWTHSRARDAALIGYAVYTSDHQPVGRIVAIDCPSDDAPCADGTVNFRVRPSIVRRLVMGANDVIIPTQLVRMVQPGARRVILQVPKDELYPPVSADRASLTGRAA